jgi:hypothetical protein
MSGVEFFFWLLGVIFLLELYLFVRTAFLHWHEVQDTPPHYVDMRPNLYAEFSPEEMQRREDEYREAVNRG